MVAIPTVHMNGTSYDELMRQVLDAHKAVQVASIVIQDMAPNGRDYYPQGDAALAAATAEHRDRRNKLESILEELEDITRGIRNQKRR